MPTRDERNRELLAKTASLLASEAPLDVLIERLCQSIAAALTSTVYVAMPGDDGAVRVAYVSVRGRRKETDNAPMPVGSRIDRVLRGGRPLMMSSIADWEGEAPVALGFRDHVPDETVSAMFVPISYGTEVLGVLTVRHPKAGRFDRDDLNLMGAVARYLGIIVRNQRALNLHTTPAKRPWSALAAIALPAVVGTGCTVFFMGASGAGIIAGIWGTAGALALVLLFTQRARRVATGLRLERFELQSEIATRIDVEERLRSAAYHDDLTGLPNRLFFFDELKDVLARSAADTEFEYAVLFIDLDRFYVVNDTLGHSAGDTLLRAISQRLQSALPPQALIARLGGDEFVLLLPSNGDALEEAVSTAEGILDELRRPFLILDRDVYTSASIGIVILERSYNEAESVLRDADISMYQAKRGGRARYAVFDRSTRERMSAQLHMETDLRGAIERGEIVAYYQPIVRVHDRGVSGFEALARWNRPGAGLVAAGEFIAVAEQTGLLRSIDAALFEHVCAATHVLVREHPDITISVNVSAADLTRPSLIDDMEAAMELHDVRPSSLRLEITETAVMEDAVRSLAVLHRLRDRGFEIVVDDFGVGQSSLSYLQRLPIGGVKIDASFIAPLGTNAQAIEILRAIVALTKTLGLSVVAEGVETAEQLRLLQTVGAEYAQGFFFSPAVETPDVRSIVAMPEGAVPDKRHAALP